MTLRAPAAIAMTASSPLRNQLFDGERNRFFASCWVIVEPPATTRPFCAFFSRALAIPSQSKPECSTNFASSAATTARFRCTEIRA
jgi:hypothetical protein